MIIRNFKKNNKRFLLLLILIPFLFRGIYKYTNISLDIIRPHDQDQDFDIILSGDNVNLEGIFVKNTLKGYDEYIFETQKGIFYPQNYPLNIDSLLGKNIELIGEIKKVGENNIFLIKETRDLDDLIVIADKKYYFIGNLLIIDTKDRPDILPILEKNNISINYQNNHLLDIKPFLCSKISSYRNCKTMIENFELSENEYFNSYNGLMFYKNSELEWTMFNVPLIGYHFDIENESTLLNISSIIYNINSEYIIKNYTKRIKERCKFDKIEDLQIESKDYNLLKTQVIGLKKKNSEICIVEFDMMNQWEIKK
ncbi:hypothetical protein K9M48_04100 [Candidatus Gracilibacteria bacterium]|nr:hypothetical protein [Candidatus Gracilibacteria bacterium]